MFLVQSGGSLVRQVFLRKMSIEIVVYIQCNNWKQEKKHMQMCDFNGVVWAFSHKRTFIHDQNVRWKWSLRKLLKEA